MTLLGCEPRLRECRTPTCSAGLPRENRVPLTFDKDFGELARKSDLPKSCGVILFRLPMPPPNEAASHLVARIAGRQDWAGHFSVIELARVRMRRLA